MAAWSRSSRSLFIFAFIYFCDGHLLFHPLLDSASVINDVFTKNNESVVRELSIELRGQNIGSGIQIKLTSKDYTCGNDNTNTNQNINNADTDSDTSNDNDIQYKIKETSIDYNNYVRLKVLLLHETHINTIFFCVQERPPVSVNYGRSGGSGSGAREVIKWSHAGRNVFIKLSPRALNSTTVGVEVEEKQPSQHNQDNTTTFNPYFAQRLQRRQAHDYQIQIFGLRIEHVYKDPLLSEDGSGVPILLADSESTIRIFGEDINDRTWVTFTQEKGNYSGACQFPATKAFQVESGDEARTRRVRVSLPLHTEDGPFYMCVKKLPPGVKPDSIDGQKHPFEHQGTDVYLQIRTYKKLLPIYVSIVIIIVCLSFSALFSGLNLGLMSLDRTELKILCNTGNEEEQKYARIIQPVRDHGNYLLCSILLGNVLVNSIFTILLDDLTSGLIAVVFATLAIVMFGEISPQALCSRHGLAVGARTIYITKAVMVITFPLSYPISKILDIILGEEIGNVYNRERLKELVKVTTDINDLDRDEVNIISGALELRKKTVSDVMTRIEDAFMLDYEAVLDFETVSEIMKSGFSRIPVYEGNRNNIVTVLYIKDLAFVDPDDNTPLKTLCQFYQNPCNFVFEDQTLDVMFKQFKEGNKGHMAFVTRVNNEGDCDPFYEIMGLVTLEDVIEELIQAEIMDETDVFTDNRSKRRRQDKSKRQDFSMFAERRENQRIHISPQLTLATYQYLSTSLEQFRPDAISEQTLRRLLNQDVFRHVKKNKKQDKNDQTTYIYQQGKPVDYFVLILEGRVEVIVGKENLVFESGPFTYFGAQALVPQTSIGKSPSSRRPTAATVSPVTAESPVVASQMGSLQSLNMDAMQRFAFSPDYSVRVVTDVLYMRVPRSLYLAAKRATLMERSTTDHNMEIDDDDKLLYSLDVDEESSQGRMSPKQTVEIHAHATNNTSPQSTTIHPHNSDTLSNIVIDPNGVATFPQEERSNGQEANDELTALIKKQQYQNVQSLQKKDTEHKPS